MPSKIMNPAALATRTGLGNVSCWAASDNRVDVTPARKIQEQWITRRFGVRPDRARLLAELAFHGGPAQ
jgi:hypothetical protein